MSASQPPIRIHKANLNDRQEWDSYVLNHVEASPYHLFAWKLAVEESYGHNCPYLFAETNGRLVGILPLVHMRLPGFVNTLVALPYCDVGNCLCDGDQVQEALLDAALKMQSTLKSDKVLLRGPLRETALKNSYFHAEVTGKVRMLLDLPTSSEELLLNFKSKLRSQIRKAERNGITFSWGEREDLDDMYAVFSRNMHELGSPVHAKSWLRNVVTHFGNRVKVGLVKCNTKVVGMGILLLGGQNVSIPWASTLREYNHLGPNMMLYWNFLRFSADNGFKMFDFGRSTMDEGTYRFKKQWGAEPRSLPWYVNQEAYRDEPPPCSGGRALACTVWRKIPLSVANALGPYLRKYISL